jgi:HK97 family phage major capsid protein
MAPDPNKFYVPYEVLERPIDPNFLVDRWGRRDIAVGTGGGAYLVGVENLGFIELLRNRTVVLKMGATRLTGLVGNVTIPKQSGAATAYWVGESAGITESQQTFVQVALSPKTCGGYTEISRQLLLQSSPGVEAIVNNDLTNVVAIAVDLGALKGTGGAGQPLGITGVSGIGSVTGANFDYGDILEFQTDVAGSNVTPLRPGYVMPSAQAGIAKQKVKFASTASPIWEGSLWDGAIDGMPAMSSEQMSSATILFGDWSQVILAEWGVLTIETNPYADFKAGIIGVRCVYSMDSALRNAGAFSYATSVSWT